MLKIYFWKTEFCILESIRFASMKIQQYISTRVHSAMRDQALTQRDVATMTGLSESTISKLIKNGNGTIHTIDKVCTALKLKIVIEAN